MSAADPLAVLVTRHLRDDRDNPRPPSDDHSIFSKHAFPLLCSVSKAVGAISEDELMGGYRRFGQWLQGHPTPVLAWVDLATGTLGQGLPDGAGIALPDRYLDLLPYRVWVLRGDSELAEGSIRETLDKASYHRLSNLVAIVDVNRLRQRGETAPGWNLDGYARRVREFGASTPPERPFPVDAAAGPWAVSRLPAQEPRHGRGGVHRHAEASGQGWLGGEPGAGAGAGGCPPPSRPLAALTEREREGAVARG
jgi:transketolase N-terminal domain/subunit